MLGGFGGKEPFIAFSGVLSMVVTGLLLYTAAGKVGPPIEPLPSLHDAVQTHHTACDSRDVDGDLGVAEPLESSLLLSSQLEMLPSAPRIGCD